MLVQLVYVSSAIDPFSPAELTELLQVSRANNAALGITGLLLHVGGNFMQALEGEEEAVDGLFQKIAADERHRLVTTVLRCPVESRLFSNWAMDFKEKNDLPAEVRAEISSFLDDAIREDGTAQEAGNPAARLLRIFALTMR